MGRINWIRVLLGGMVAGVVIFLGEWLFHGVLLRADWMAAMESIGRPVEPGDEPIALYVVISLTFGLAIAWTYAAARPRFGPGPGTAVRAGLLIWVVGYVLPTLAWIPVNVFTNRIILIGLGGGLVELLVAALLAGLLYKEE